MVHNLTLALLCMWLSGIALICIYLSERAAKQDLLARLNRQVILTKSVEVANRCKAEFLAYISHEIRTPMNAILGFTDLALKANLQQELREDLVQVRSSADWLMHIVNDILEFARADAGSLQLDRVTFSISECIQSTIKTFQPEIRAKNLSFQSRIDPRLPGRVCGDPTRLRHVLFNLLDNAVRFTTSGGIALILKLESVTAQKVAIRVSVADTGVGVALERQKYIFEPFRPTNPAESGQFGFNGLGLAIARKIVELMGGSMEFQSQLGAGTTFSFTASFHVVQEPVQPSDLPVAPASQLSVLVAEDNAVNRRLLTKVLESAGHHVTPVPDGTAAVRMVTTGNYDLVFMDLEMPELNGLEATRQIRAAEASNVQVPIYALTAHALPVDRSSCLEAGMDGFLSKPVRMEELLKVMSTVEPALNPS